MKNYLLYNLSLLLVLTALVPLQAQQIAEVYGEASASLYQDQHYTLQEILTQLEDQYDIIFDYDTQVVNEKKVKQGVVDEWAKKQNLEEQLQDLLGPLHLTYEKYSDNSFLIRSPVKQVETIPLENRKLQEGT
ncbi:MAG: hypothetical protein WBA23_07500, partial [Tunicatimonas sp.]|uniref:hypothetical protein n=1 Tax=Tunicatimonas sp. TaxID=1940096 RepID=UPI003C796CD6